ncbi:MAG: hypothetical protein HXX16_17935 [Bacteroidales bacterium]|nr:hypothetical protein [Bacteroidales bacterium]
MTIKTLIILSVIVFCISCKKDIKPTIQTEYLKSDWVISDSLCLYIEDSTVLTDISPFGYENVFKYFISGDSLILRRIMTPWKKSDFNAVFKILELSKDKLNLQFIRGHENVFPYSPNKNFYFINNRNRKNNKIIKYLEFSSSYCFGHCPVIDLKIEQDSMLFIKCFRSTRSNGLFQHKLTKVEFDRINQKFNRINLDSFHLGSAPVDVQSYSFLIQTEDTLTLRCSGSSFSINKFDNNFSLFIYYLTNLDWLIELNKSNLDSLSIQDNSNRQFYKRTK